MSDERTIVAGNNRQEAREIILGAKRGYSAPMSEKNSVPVRPVGETRRDVESGGIYHGTLDSGLAEGANKGIVDGKDVYTPPGYCVYARPAGTPCRYYKNGDKYYFLDLECHAVEVPEEEPAT